MSTTCARPEANAIHRAIHHAQATDNLFAGGPLVVAVSGGADSVCLLHALWTLGQAVDSKGDHDPALALHLTNLHVAHLDHALRPGSADDAAFVAELAARWGLPFHSRRLPDEFLRAQPGNLEANARRARYNFLSEVAQKIVQLLQCSSEENLRRISVEAPPGHSTQSLFFNLYSSVATAHHADDQAETLLLHLLRGSGLHGLAGMRPVSDWPMSDWPVSDWPVGDLDCSEGEVAPRLVRPLLHVTRAQILAYLHAHHLSWRDDPTNADESHLRNRLRHRVMPLLADINPSVAETLTRSAQILADEADRGARADRQALDAVLVEQRPARIVLNVAVANKFDVATQRGLLRLAVEALRSTLASSAREDATFAQIETLRGALAEQAVGGPHPLGHGVAWTLFVDEADSPRLSLHGDNVPPLAPHHPHLDAAAWPTSGAPVQPGHAVDAGGWSLRATLLDRATLPAGWDAPVDGLAWRAFLDAERAQTPLLVTPRAGMRVAPLGMGGQHKTLGDFFTDAKVPAPLRPGWPLVVDGNGEILWVGGFAPSHPARIQSGTTSVLHLFWHSTNSTGRL